jgi:hypothetical protein
VRFKAMPAFKQPGNSTTPTFLRPESYPALR